MTYDPTQPASTTSPALSVGDIQTNFAQFFNVFKANHVALNDFNQGKHSAIILEKQTADPTVTDDQVTVYAKDATSGLGTEPQLFAKIKETNLFPDLPFQLTLNQVNVIGPQYQSFLMGSYLVYVGSTTNIAVSITLTPAPTSILCVQAVPQDVTAVGGFPYMVGVEVTQPDTIKINSSNAVPGTTFLWFAIGAA